MIFNTIAAISMLQTLNYYGLYQLLPCLISRKTRDSMKSHALLVHDKVKRRLARDANEERCDLMSSLLTAQGEGKLHREELDTMAKTFIEGGSETTATALSAIIYFLLKNEVEYQRLTSEIRDSFLNEEDISITSTGKLKYLQAVIKEGLRMFPPVPSTLPRVVPTGGEYVAGVFVPGNTVIGVHQYAAYRSERNFARPDEFLPQRFLEDEKGPYPEFCQDQKGVLQPFGYGPRNCVGQGLVRNSAVHRSTLSLIGINRLLRK
jgi:cytochrome P450